MGSTTELPAIAMTAIAGSYDYRLVALSLGIALLTSYTALDLAGRVTANRGSARIAWLAGGAFAMGSGIWCMHYTGMMAMRLPLPVHYHVPTVVFSLLAAIVASLIALYVVSRERMSAGHIIAGSVLMGSSIATMHYTGMAAMRLQAMHHYDPVLWVLSIFLAVIISLAGLLLIFYSREERRSWKLRAATALAIGLAIPVMHYSGMAAISFMPTQVAPDLSNSVDISTVADFAILSVTFVILGFALITSLVDRRLSAKQLILDSERKMLRALIDNIPDFMYVKDSESRFVIANPQLARNLGRDTPQELIGKTDFDFYPAEYAEILYDAEQGQMLTGESLFNHEEVFVDSAGCEIPVLTTKVPLRDGKGAVTGIASVSHNISKRKKNEDALREAERRYRGIFDEAIVGIYQISVNGRLIGANPAMANIFGYATPSEMIASTKRAWEVHVDPKRQEEFMSLMAQFGRVQNFECEVFRRDRSTIWISSNMSSISESGAAVRYEGMCEDVTERKLLRDQLFQAQKLESVGQLAAGIAHEINTPVQYIGDNVHFLRDTFRYLVKLIGSYDRLLSAARAQNLTSTTIDEVAAEVAEVDVAYLLQEIPRALEQTLEGIDRVSGLVGAMKEFSHPGIKEKIPLDLNHAIQSTITVARSEWKYVAEMQIDFDPELPLISCLPGEFNQAILNLIVNAAHAIGDVVEDRDGEKGKITVQTRDYPGWVEIRIGDTGGGIPETIRGRIFDPFFTTKEIGKGTGQGLAITRSAIVDKHQGRLDFETAMGVGTTFVIQLPHDGETLSAGAVLAGVGMC
jgi:PAS domain S-box-containing protein